MSAPKITFRYKFQNVQCESKWKFISFFEIEAADIVIALIADNKMFRFFHGYMPKVWEAQVKAGFIGENDRIRFCQSAMLDGDSKFNKLAAKGGDLYNIIAERKCPFYIDRLQGGSYIDDYEYDEDLLNEYRELLGENFSDFKCMNGCQTIGMMCFVS